MEGREELRNQLEEVKNFLEDWKVRNPYNGSLEGHNLKFSVDSETFIKNNPANKVAKTILK